MIYSKLSKSTNHLSQLQSGAAILVDNRRYWDFNAFTQKPLYIEQAANKIAHLNEGELWALDNDAQKQAHYFSNDFPSLFHWLAQCEPKQTSTTMLPAIPFWLHTDIPGRKWQQIQLFCAASQHQTPNNTAAHAIEWCAGKGHLGRLHCWLHEQPVVSVEWQKSLCVQGQQQAKKLKLAQHFINADIHKLPFSAELDSPNWLALHACGDLHCEFLHTAVQHQAAAIALAPCCYHRQKAPYYQALSKTAQQSGLPNALNLQALRLAQQNQITAGNRERQQRARELKWRFGYEKLRQTQQPGTSYKNLPSTQKQSFENFEQFCHWAAQHHQLTLAINIQWQQFEDLGKQERLHMMQRDAIRHCFRRPLELWLALDKAVFLEERGYTATLQQFCESEISPRNLLLLANRDIKRPARH